MDQDIIYVGLDSHKQTTAVALAETVTRGELRERSKVVNTPNSLKTLPLRQRATEASYDFAMKPSLAVISFSVS
jgi:hypothetical protein